MKLTFKYSLNKLTKVNKDVLDDLLWHTTKTYNMLLYDIKNRKFEINVSKSLNILSSSIYKEYRKDNWHSEYLHSHSLQQVIINLLSNYKSYIKANKEYEKNKIKFKGRPQCPGFKQENKQGIVFTKYGIRIENNLLKLSLSKKMQKKYQVKSLNFLILRKLKKLVNFKSIKMIRIVKIKEEYKMEIVYEKEEKILSEENTNIIAIDLGLNNIVACTNLENTNTLLIDGKQAKSVNHNVSNKITKLQSISMKMQKTSKVKNTKQIEKLYKYRKNYMNTYMHKVSKMVVEYAKENKVSKIIIGNLKDIKQGMNYNKNFVQIPIQNLVEKIEYKAKLEGIAMEKISEKYTSGVSAIDKEEIKKENYNKKRRISRGIFITNKGIKLNADINGSLNILRKYIKNSSPNLEIAMDNGREQRPLKKRVA